MEKEIIYFGQKAKVGCDEKCNKAWGISVRPKIQLTENCDDYIFLSDDDLGDAPVDPCTSEGWDSKPTSDEEKMNKWCVRECERCEISEPNKFNEPLVLDDWNKKIYNTIDSKVRYEELFNSVDFDYWLGYALGEEVITDIDDIEDEIEDSVSTYTNDFTEPITGEALILVNYISQYLILTKGGVDKGIIDAVIMQKG